MRGKHAVSRTVDLRTGEAQRGKIYPGAREAVREWLERFEAGTGAHFALEGTTGWRSVAEEIQRRGFVAHLADPAELSTLRGPKRRPRGGNRQENALAMGVLYS